MKELMLLLINQMKICKLLAQMIKVLNYLNINLFNILFIYFYLL